jgi:hypothetical protein
MGTQFNYAGIQLNYAGIQHQTLVNILGDDLVLT